MIQISFKFMNSIVYRKSGLVFERLRSSEITLLYTLHKEIVLLPPNLLFSLLIQYMERWYLLRIFLGDGFLSGKAKRLCRSYVRSPGKNYSLNLFTSIQQQVEYMQFQTGNGAWREKPETKVRSMELAPPWSPKAYNWLPALANQLISRRNTYSWPLFR